MEEYERISRNVPGPECPWESVELLAGCGCAVPCCESDSCSCMSSGLNYHPETGYLLERPDTSPPIVECGSLCGCVGGGAGRCGNRVVGRSGGLGVGVDVVEVEGKGRGVRTTEGVRRGRFVAEYVGELLGEGEAERRRSQQGDHNYIFKVQEFVFAGSVVTCVDPSRKGNVARFINHSCDPNLQIVLVRYDIAAPHVALFAQRDIACGEELSYSYGRIDVDSCRKSTKPCLCLSKNCSGILPNFDS